MAVAPANAAQLILLAQQEIHHCHLQRRGLDLHLSALESLLKQVGEAFNLNTDLPPVVAPQPERAAGQSAIDPPGFGPQSSTQPESGRKTAKKASKRPKTPRATTALTLPKGPVQILKAPTRDAQLETQGPAVSEPNPEELSLPPTTIPNVSVQLSATRFLVRLSWPGFFTSRAGFMHTKMIR